MLLFRFICAFLMAWGINWAMGRPEAAVLRDDFPEFALIAPFAAAYVGLQNLARRQGWGSVVAVANGVWAGVMTLGLSLLAFLFIKVVQTPQAGTFDADFLLRQIGEHAADMIDAMASLPLLVICLGATTVVSLVSEFIHWALVHLRRLRGIKERNTRRAHRPSMYG